MRAIVYSKYRFAFLGGFLGLFVSMICYLIALFKHDVSDWMLVVWPSMIMLMAVFQPGVTAFVGILLSVLVNVLLYAAIGHLVALALMFLAYMRKGEVEP